MKETLFCLQVQFIYLFARLGLELKVMHLLGRHSLISVMPPAVHIPFLAKNLFSSFYDRSKYNEHMDLFNREIVLEV